ncbi:hypothetical protein BX666DRAFT_1644877 [Dichotomocladium elegans]|nr:hypothetical protein BX666DRAFT_1644877 [Dichotomocladium elegans]
MDLEKQAIVPSNDENSSASLESPDSVNANAEELALIECRQLVREVEDRIRFWSKMTRRSPAFPKEQLEAAEKQAEDMYNKLAARRSEWTKKFPYNGELTGGSSCDVNITPDDAASTSPSSPLPTSIVPDDLPCLQELGSEDETAGRKNLYLSAAVWADAFERSVQEAGLSVEDHFLRLLDKALNATQHEKVTTATDDYLRKHPDQTCTWQTVRQIIVTLFDSPLQKRKCIRNILDCVQLENESLVNYVERFQSTLQWPYKNEEIGLFIQETFVGNMTEEWQAKIESLPAECDAYDGAEDTGEALQNPEGDSSMPTTKRIHHEQDSLPSRKVVRNKTEQSTRPKSAPPTKAKEKNWCRHCLKHGKKNPFSRKHKCPYYRVA